jgi:hypothetical protein
MLGPNISLDVYDVIAAWFAGRCLAIGEPLAPDPDLRAAANRLRQGLSAAFPDGEANQMLAAASVVLMLIAERFAEANADCVEVAGHA